MPCGRYDHFTAGYDLAADCTDHCFVAVTVFRASGFDLVGYLRFARSMLFLYDNNISA